MSQSAAPPPAVFAKSAICWLRVGERDWPVWYAPVEGMAYVVSGGGEQQLPDLPAEVRITLRAKDTREYAGRFPAMVQRVAPDDHEWEAAVGALRSARLNAPHSGAAARWAEHSTVWVVRPDFAAPEPVTRDDPGSAAEPAPTTATTRGRMPAHLGRRSRP